MRLGKKSKPRRKVALVEWIDAFDTASVWSNLEELHPGKPKTCQSVGFLVENLLEEYITLVTSDDGDGYMANGIHIPLVNIKSIKYLS